MRRIRAGLRRVVVLSACLATTVCASRGPISESVAEMRVESQPVSESVAQVPLLREGIPDAFGYLYYPIDPHEGSFRGVVREPDGTPAAGARVTVFRSDSWGSTATRRR